MTITHPVLGQFDETMDLRLQRAFYRARSLVTVRPLVLYPAKGTEALVSGNKVHVEAGSGRRRFRLTAGRLICYKQGTQSLSAFGRVEISHLLGLGE